MATAQLIDYTGAGRLDADRHAANLLVFTKNTRLNMESGLLQKIQSWSHERIEEELQYMATTIPSSWEFVNLTFLLQGVSRATAQQITRTRTASYAMQSLRVVDASDIGVVNPFFSDGTIEQASLFAGAHTAATDAYSQLIKAGATPQDARGLLPLNTECNLVAQYNLRSFVELCIARRSLRTQGEYANLVEQMHAVVVHVWPWSAPFFASKHDSAIQILEEAVEEVGLNVGSGPGWKIAKAIDLLRKER